jgi:hypothetical protein
MRAQIVHTSWMCVALHTSLEDFWGVKGVGGGGGGGRMRGEDGEEGRGEREGRE